MYGSRATFVLPFEEHTCICIQNFIFKVRSEGIPVYFYIRVKNKNKYYLSGHFIWFLK